MRYAAQVAYDGTAYRGFQLQPNGPTIQQMLEEALNRIGGQAVRVTCAGRTDAGVHATGQVIAFDLEWRHPAESLLRALNASLPPDIAVWRVWQAASDFNPRFDAVSRTYVYKVYTADARDPLRWNSAWRITKLLNVHRMNEAAESLVGTHDFLSFGLPPKGENSVRTVHQASWEMPGARDYTFSITANAFLYRMVRVLAATLAQVGQERMTVAEFRVILAARQRGLAAAPAPACGLTLTEVSYQP